MKIHDYNSFDYYKFRGNYAVRMYKRNGDGHGVTYTKTLSEAEKIRTEHGLSIGLYPEPTYIHFALYPTIWKWDDAAGMYDRLLGY